MTCRSFTRRHKIDNTDFQRRQINFQSDFPQFFRLGEKNLPRSVAHRDICFCHTHSLRDAERRFILAVARVQCHLGGYFVLRYVIKRVIIRLVHCTLYQTTKQQHQKKHCFPKIPKTHKSLSSKSVPDIASFHQHPSSPP